MTDPSADDEWQARALAAFPCEIVETTGEEALTRWEQLKSAGRGVPVVVGDLSGILRAFSEDEEDARRPVEEILAAADAIRFPEGLFRMRQDQVRAALGLLRELDPSGADEIGEEEEEPPLGEWPGEIAPSIGLSVARDVATDEPLSKVHILLVPTSDPTTVPAYLQWGGWNACPAAEYHVAALRHWRDRYGAELVGMDADTLNIRVARKPATCEEAIALARLQHVYCSDIVEQGTETISVLAAGLMAHDWWFFWWD
ncbi:MAG: DUF4253 domain-containing protein [Pseudomonadota bacterium]